MKVVPFSISLFTSMVPSIASTRRCVMAKPRPVPSYCRVEEVSAWLNRSKIFLMASCSIPIPVSSIRICILASQPSHRN